MFFLENSQSHDGNFPCLSGPAWGVPLPDQPAPASNQTTRFQAVLLAFKHILELLEGVNLVEVNFLCLFIEIGDSFVDGELGTKFSTVNGLLLLVYIVDLCSGACKSPLEGFSCSIFLRMG